MPEIILPESGIVSPHRICYDLIDMTSRSLTKQGVWHYFSDEYRNMINSRRDLTLYHFSDKALSSHDSWLPQSHQGEYGFEETDTELARMVKYQLKTDPENSMLTSNQMSSLLLALWENRQKPEFQQATAEILAPATDLLKTCQPECEGICKAICYTTSTLVEYVEKMKKGYHKGRWKVVIHESEDRGSYRETAEGFVDDAHHGNESKAGPRYVRVMNPYGLPFDTSKEQGPMEIPAHSVFWKWINTAAKGQQRPVVYIMIGRMENPAEMAQNVIMANEIECPYTCKALVSARMQSGEKEAEAGQHGI